MRCVRKLHCQWVHNKFVYVVKGKRIGGAVRSVETLLMMGTKIALVVCICMGQTPRMRNNHVDSGVRGVHVGVVRGKRVGGDL